MNVSYDTPILLTHKKLLRLLMMPLNGSPLLTSRQNELLICLNRLGPLTIWHF